ncbi:MAG TPA: hypothetical protein VID19_03965 [Candidatus Eremiobacteraceae bacterium]
MLDRFRALSRHWPILLPIAFECVLFHAWIGSGLVIGSDWVRRSQDELLSFFPWPHAWSGAQQIGENQEVYMTSFPIFALCGLIAKLGGGWELAERLCYLWPYLILSVWGSYALGYRLTRSPLASAAGSFIFITSTWTVALVERGGIPSIVAAAIIPFIAIAALSFIDKPSPRKGVLLSALFLVQMTYDLRYVYIAIVLCAIIGIDRLIRDGSLRRLRLAVPGMVAAAIALLGFNLYWIVPQIVSPAQAPPGYGSTFDYTVTSAYMSMTHSLALFNAYFHWVADDSPFQAAPVDPSFYFLPVLAFLGLALSWRRRCTRAIAFAAFLCILLDSGPNPPLGPINVWIYAHVPGMSLFRDITKWMSLHSLAYAIALTLGLSSLFAILRRRLGKVNAQRMAVATLVVVTVGYTWLMRDAFNPTRYRSFTSEPRPADVVQLENFLDSGADFYRTLVFPRDIEPMRAGERHPYVEAQQVANGAGYDGFRDYDSDWSSIFWFYSSPFIPDLMRELNIRYVVVPYDDDRIVYKLGLTYTEFNEAIDFLHSRPWLKFDRVIGRHYVFEVRNWTPVRGFIAPAPVVLNGSGESIDALMRTPFWSSRAAVLLSGQNPDPNLLAKIPNVIDGAQLVNRDDYSPDDYARVVAQLHSYTAFADAAPLAYRGFAATTSAMTSNVKNWRAPKLFNVAFATRAPARTDINLLYYEPRELPGDAMRVDFRQVATIPHKVTESRAPVLFNDISDANQQYSTNAPGLIAVVPNAGGVELSTDKGLGAGAWFGFYGVAGTITVTNAIPVAERGDLLLPAFVSATQLPLSVKLSLNGLVTEFTAPPRSLGWLLGGGQPIVLHDVTLYPGTNNIQVTLGLDDTTGDLRNQVTMLLRGDLTVSHQQALTATADQRPLGVTVFRSQEGLVLSAQADAPTEIEQRAAYPVFDRVDIPLDEEPFLDIDYLAPANTVILQLEVTLRRPADGARFRYLENLNPYDTHYFGDIRLAIGKALDAEFRRSLDLHRDDPAWLRKHRLADEGDGAAAYEMTGVFLTIVKPAGAESAGGPGGRFVAHLGSANLSIGSPWIGPRVSERVAASADMSGITLSNGMSVEGMRLLQLVPDKRLLQLTLQLADSPRAVDPGNGLLGDEATFSLADGSQMQGVVTRESGGTVTIDSKSRRFAVQRSAIVKIVDAARYVSQSAKVTIPIEAPADAHYLQLLISTPRQLETHMLLGFSTSSNGKVNAVVFPGRQPDYTTTEEAIPNQWVTTQPSPFEVQSIKLGEPRDFADIAADYGAVWTQYRIDLQQVKDYRLQGNPRAKLVRIYLTFDPLPGLSTASGQLARIAIGGVEAIMGSKQRQAPNTFLGQSSITLDETPMHAATLQKPADVELYTAQAPSLVLPAGVHALASRSTPPWRVDAALLSQGTPKTFATADLTGFRIVTPTEYEGRVDSHGGLLVLTEAYDRGWQLALVADDFHPTGFALLDYVRLRAAAIPAADHHPVDDMLNGWWMPAGRQHLVALFVPQAAVELGLLLTLLFVAGLIAVLRRWPSW